MALGLKNSAEQAARFLGVDGEEQPNGTENIRALTNHTDWKLCIYMYIIPSSLLLPWPRFPAVSTKGEGISESLLSLFTTLTPRASTGLTPSQSSTCPLSQGLLTKKRKDWFYTGCGFPYARDVHSQRFTVNFHSLCLLQGEELDTESGSPLGAA